MNFGLFCQFYDPSLFLNLAFHANVCPIRTLILIYGWPGKLVYTKCCPLAHIG